MRASILKLLPRAVVLATLLISPLAAQSGGQSRIDLSGDWLIKYSHDRSFARPDYQDGRWRTVSLPANLARKRAKAKRILWLRKHVSLTKRDTNLALVLGPVYDSDMTYFNGKLIGRGKSKSSRPDGYGRPRIYSIPSNLIREGDNVIAIRLKGSFKDEIGIISGPLAIEPTGKAQWTLLKKDLKELIYAAVYLVIGGFFILLYFRIKELREYLWFGFFAVTFAVLQLARNEFRFNIVNHFIAFKLIEQISYPVLVTLFLFFFRELFKIKYHRLVMLYPLINAITVIALLVLNNPIWWDRIIGYWFLVNLPFFGYYAYYVIKRAATTQEREAIIVAGGLMIMLGATVHYFLVERGFLAPPSPFNAASVFFMLSISLALIYRMIKLQLEVEERQDRLNQVNELRDRVFNYINTLVRKPADNVARLGEEIVEGGGSTEMLTETIGELKGEVDALQTDLDDILELSRLEVIQEPEYVEAVNFNDFITAVIPQGEITCYIKVNPDIELRTSLELVNSIVIRLIDFPGFKAFDHIDLIITSDLKQNVHFRFLMFHNNFRETRKLYETLTSLNPESGALWVKWAIVREIIRILNGDLQINILNRKFLRIDIKLAANLPRDAVAAARGTGNIEVEYVQPGMDDDGDLQPIDGGTENGNLGEADALAAAARATPSQPPPAFSKDMDVGDFFKAVGARLKRK